MGGQKGQGKSRRQKETSPPSFSLNAAGVRQFQSATTTGAVSAAEQCTEQGWLSRAALSGLHSMPDQRTSGGALCYNLRSGWERFDRFDGFQGRNY